MQSKPVSPKKPFVYRLAKPSNLYTASICGAAEIRTPVLQKIIIRQQTNFVENIGLEPMTYENKPLFFEEHPVHRP